jgi:hypothetical protein
LLRLLADSGVAMPRSRQRDLQAECLDPPLEPLRFNRWSVAQLEDRAPSVSRCQAAFRIEWATATVALLERRRRAILEYWAEE